MKKEKATAGLLGMFRKQASSGAVAGGVPTMPTDDRPDDGVELGNV